MTNATARARLWLRNSDSLADSRGSGVEENGVRAGVKIFLRPSDGLTAFFAGTAVAARRFATDRADEFGGVRSL